ncbi:MAG TPA: M48 family metalloprotease [Candidatus Dormibacteraeota bacterium]|nr:M48 family metalloprotease [Candidatus Dormibacteraeota bacterium]
MCTEHRIHRHLQSQPSHNHKGFRTFARGAATLAALLVILCPANAQRTKLKAPWNLYSPQTDIQQGKLFAGQVQKQASLCNDPKVDAYLTQLGLRLASKLPTNGVQYPWEFHCVNDKQINAFALPGGYVFINRGAIEAASNESQLAGVMAHELSHVALRHGTAQASKASLVQGTAAIFGGVFGGTTGGDLLTTGVALGGGSALLHYSRAAETQADVMGTQVLYDTGYDPRALAQFFEKLEAEHKGKNPPQFFSDHPNPGNRLARVDEEVTRLGGVPENAKRDSAEFEDAKRRVMALPVVKKPVPGVLAPAAPPSAPSANYIEYRAPNYGVRYPDNWKKFGEGNNVTLAPEGGLIAAADGKTSLAYGVSASVEQLPAENGNAGLDAATQKLIQSLQQGNPRMRVARDSRQITLNGQPGLSTYLDNESAAGGVETDWLITVLQPDGSLFYVVCVAPKNKYADFERAFNDVLDSVRFTN